MSGTGEFRRRAEEALHALHGLLAPASEDWSFEVRLRDGGLRLSFEPAGPTVSATPHAAGRQVWLAAGSGTFKLGWDIGKNAFVSGATGQRLKELVRSVVSERMGEDVPL